MSTPLPEIDTSLCQASFKINDQLHILSCKDAESFAQGYVAAKEPSSVAFSNITMSYSTVTKNPQGFLSTGYSHSHLHANVGRSLPYEDFIRLVQCGRPENKYSNTDWLNCLKK